MNGPRCARPGCDNEVHRTPGRRGRPAIYCSPACRPSLQVANSGGHIVVEVEQVPADGDGHLPTGRDWLVRIRRGKRSTVVAQDLGRFSATVLAGELRAVVEPQKRATRPTD